MNCNLFEIYVSSRKFFKIIDKREVADILNRVLSFIKYLKPLELYAVLKHMCFNCFFINLCISWGNIDTFVMNFHTDDAVIRTPKSYLMALCGFMTFNMHLNMVYLQCRLHCLLLFTDIISSPF